MAQAEKPNGKATWRAASLMAALALGWTIAAWPGILWRLTEMGQTPLFSPDDAMRLVQVRDLIAGQGWFDLTQHRLGAQGVEMHWSRLLDAPLAALILALRPVLGAAGAEAVVVFAWPLLLILPALAATAAAGRALAGGAGIWAASLIMGMALANTARFVPGQIDHHNLQLALLIVAVSLLARATMRPRAAWGAGAAIAASIAVGVELLPVHALVLSCAACAWAASGASMRAVLPALMLGFAGALGLLFLATAPASAWAGGYCDALSRDLLAPALTGALGLAAAARWLSGATWPARLAALATVGAAALAVALTAAPACLSDPLSGIDPLLRAQWLERVAEAEGWATLIARSPQTQIPALAAALAGLGSAALLAWRTAGERWLWVTLGGTLALGLALALWQHRAAMVLEPLSVLPVATLAVRLFRGEGRRAPLGAMALLLVALPAPWAALLPRLLPQVPTAPAASAPESWKCYGTDAMAPLSALPPGLVSASSNLGAHILLAGPQRVLSAPYHRNTAGMTAQLRIALADDDAAEALLRQHRVDYVIACRHDAEYAGGTGFGARLQGGQVPAFLTPLAQTADGVAIYRLRPDGASGS